MNQTFIIINLISPDETVTFCRLLNIKTLTSLPHILDFHCDDVDALKPGRIKH